MSRRCKVYVYTGVFIVAVLLMALIIKLFFFSGWFTPLLSLKGEKVMEVQVKKSFQDPGVKARYHLKDFQNDVRTTSNVNRNRIGEYTIVYEWKNKTVERIVKVVDKKAPKLKLKGDNPLRIFENETYQEAGYTAIDDYDGDLTAKVQIKNNVNTKKQGNYKIIYSVKDKNGNQSSVERQVEVCPDPTNQKLYYNYDSYDNKMEEWWFEKSKNHERNKGALSSSLLSKYNTCYLGPDEKVIYLTFDEGGNDITYIKEIANVLNKHNVKATFFLTRNYIKNEADFIRDLVKHGHVIGNHTWHHYDMTTLANASKVDDFVKEITETSKTYMEVVGEPMKKIFRFPKGGASERTMKMVSDLGYKSFNWSHAYYDFASDVSKEEALKTLIDHYHNGAIYLLHPSNKGNYEAMDEFLTQMEKLGYRFDTVDHIQIIK